MRWTRVADFGFWNRVAYGISSWQQRCHFFDWMRESKGRLVCKWVLDFDGSVRQIRCCFWLYGELLSLLCSNDY